MTISSAEEIVRMTSTILQDEQMSCVNQVSVLLNELESFKTSPGDRESVLQALIKNLGRIFCKYIDVGELLQVENRTRNPNVEKINQFKGHLVKWYERIIHKLVSILQDESFPLAVKEESLHTLIRFIEEEGKFPFREQEYNFPSYILDMTLRALISCKNTPSSLFKNYCKLFRFDDFIHFTMLELANILDETEDQDALKNCFEVLKSIKLTRPDNLLPEFLKEDRKLDTPVVAETKKATDVRTNYMRMCPLSSGTRPEYGSKIKFDYERDAEIYSKLWVKLFKHDCDSTTFKQALIHLDKYALQHFSNPLLLADYLFDLFSSGGLISLLSMSPLYVIISRCQVEYPNFYKTLYNLLEPAVLYRKYRAQFLFWCDLFLTSTHISSKVVASFAKRLSRIALRSSPDTCSVLLPFIGNLFIRHPMIQSMLRSAKFEPTNDPFLSDEEEPELTCALQSYMWELKALQAHYSSDISTIAKNILEVEQTVEWNQEDTLETTIDDLIENEANKVNKVGRGTYDMNCNVFYSI